MDHVVAALSDQGLHSGFFPLAGMEGRQTVLTNTIPPGHSWAFPFQLVCRFSLGVRSCLVTLDHFFETRVLLCGPGWLQFLGSRDPAPQASEYLGL